MGWKKKVRASEPLPAILTPEQVTRLLEVAAEETLPYSAIGALAGLRSAELCELPPRWVPRWLHPTMRLLGSFPCRITRKT